MYEVAVISGLSSFCMFSFQVIYGPWHLHQLQAEGNMYTIKPRGPPHPHISFI